MCLELVPKTRLPIRTGLPLQTKKSRTFLDKIAGDMLNKRTLNNPNSPSTSRIKNELQYE